MERAEESATSIVAKDCSPIPISSREDDDWLRKLVATAKAAECCCISVTRVMSQTMNPSLSSRLHRASGGQGDMSARCSLRDGVSA